MKIIKPAPGLYPASGERVPLFIVRLTNMQRFTS